MRIAIVGTHGTGKTTLSYQIAAYYKRQGKNVKIIQEAARGCPFAINENMTIEAAKWIYLEHSRKELEACKYEVIVSDRSSYDSFAYAEHFGLTDDMLERYRWVSIKELDTYDRLIFIRPNTQIQKDGMRSTDRDFQASIDSIFEKVLKHKRYIEFTSSDVFKEQEEWIHFCL